MIIRTDHPPTYPGSRSYLNYFMPLTLSTATPFHLRRRHSPARSFRHGFQIMWTSATYVFHNTHFIGIRMIHNDRQGRTDETTTDVAEWKLRAILRYGVDGVV